jgi:hypothetical protein
MLNVLISIEQRRKEIVAIILGRTWAMHAWHWEQKLSTARYSVVASSATILTILTKNVKANGLIISNELQNQNLSCNRDTMVSFGYPQLQRCAGVHRTKHGRDVQ